MGDKKVYIFSLVIISLVIGLFISSWDSAYQITGELGWVLKQLPEVKSVEYLDALRKS
jgi:hypothetical protein